MAITTTVSVDGRRVEDSPHPLFHVDPDALRELLRATGGNVNADAAIDIQIDTRNHAVHPTSSTMTRAEAMGAWRPTEWGAMDPAADTTVGYDDDDPDVGATRDNPPPTKPEPGRAKPKTQREHGNGSPSHTAKATFSGKDAATKRVMKPEPAQVAAD